MTGCSSTVESSALKHQRRWEKSKTTDNLQILTWLTEAQWSRKADGARTRTGHDSRTHETTAIACNVSRNSACTVYRDRVAKYACQRKFWL